MKKKKVHLFYFVNACRPYYQSLCGKRTKNGPNWINNPLGVQIDRLDEVTCEACLKILKMKVKKYKRIVIVGTKVTSAHGLGKVIEIREHKSYPYKIESINGHIDWFGRAGFLILTEHEFQERKRKRKI